MAKGIADHIDALILARIKPLEDQVKRVEKFAELQQDTIETLDGEIEELYHRLHELED